MVKNQTSKKIGKLIPQSQLGLGVIVVLSIVILMSILGIFFLEGFFARASTLLGIVALGLSAVLTWQSNVTNQNTNIFEKLKQACLGQGVIVIIASFIIIYIFLNIIVWLFGGSGTDNSALVFAFIFSSLIGLKSNKSLTKDGELIERTWIDAIVITLGQIALILGALIAAAFIMAMIRIISNILWRLFGRY